MKKLLSLTLFGVLAFSFSSESKAINFTSGADFYEACSTDDANPNLPACLAYLEGYAAGEYLGVMQASSKLNPGALEKGGMPYLESNFNYCAPQKITTKEILSVVYNWLEANPTERKFTLNVTVNEALKAEYPCKLQAGKLLQRTTPQ